MIDIGGPVAPARRGEELRHVAAVSRPDQYDGGAGRAARRDGEISRETRRRLAAEAFAATAAYEAAIAALVRRDEPFPGRLTSRYRRCRPRVRREPAPAGRVLRGDAPRLARREQLHGKALSFNNLNDLAAARRCSHELADPACAIVKHANPCGAAVAATIGDAYERALAGDPASAYGGVVALEPAGRRGARPSGSPSSSSRCVGAGLRPGGARALARQAGDPHPRDRERRDARGRAGR